MNYGTSAQTTPRWAWPENLGQSQIASLCWLGWIWAGNPLGFRKNILKVLRKFVTVIFGNFSWEVFGIGSSIGIGWAWGGWPLIFSACPAWFPKGLGMGFSCGYWTSDHSYRSTAKIARKALWSLASAPCRGSNSTDTNLPKIFDYNQKNLLILRCEAIWHIFW